MSDIARERGINRSSCAHPLFYYCRCEKESERGGKKSESYVIHSGV